MKVLIDSDILVYRIGFTTQDVPIEIACARMDDLIYKIIEATSATSHQCYLTASNDETAFRRKIYPEYKANRKAAKPIHYVALREYLVERWAAVMVSTIEADDAMAMAQTHDTIIASLDKDLDMVVGLHYNFVKEIIYSIDLNQAMYNFYTQMLIGDTADNVKGIQGIGPKKASQILNGAYEEEDLFTRVRDAYSNDDEMLQNGEVLWMMLKPYPYGRWRYTDYGSQLVQEETPYVNCSCEMIEPTSECIGEVPLMDGSLLNGLTQLDNTTQLQGGTAHLT